MKLTEVFSKWFLYLSGSSDKLRFLSSQNNLLSDENLVLNNSLNLLRLELSSVEGELEQAKLMVPKKVDVMDVLYWNGKWSLNQVFYAAPKRQDIRKYLAYKKIPEIEKVALEVVRSTPEQTVLAVMHWLKDKFDKKEFKYLLDKSEKWNSPEETLNEKIGDCDDYSILEYFIIRQAFMDEGWWESHKHRLKCVCGNINNKGVPTYREGHFYLLWLGNELEWFGVEGTFWLEDAISDFGILPHKYNSTYGTIWWTFNEDWTWSQNSTDFSRKEWRKQ